MENEYAENENLLKMYFRQIRKFPLLTFEEEKKLSKAILAGDKAAKKRLIECNLRLVVKIANNGNREVPFLDKIQFGNIGLIRAAEKYDYHKNIKFSTYGAWWIKQAIERGCADDRTIRLPFRKYEGLKKLTKENARSRIEKGHSMTDEEIYEKFKITHGALSVLLSVYPKAIGSLDDVVEDGNPNYDTRYGRKISLHDAVEDMRYLPEIEMLDEDMKGDICRTLDVLPEEEKLIIMGRYGLSGEGKKKTLRVLGEEMGFSREKVRQIEMRALKRLRTCRDAENLRVYLVK